MLCRECLSFRDARKKPLPTFAKKWLRNPLAVRLRFPPYTSQFVAGGAYIVKIGDIAQEMFFIIEGQVEYVDQKYRVFSHGNAGEFFGELGLLYSIPRTASVRAATDVQVLILNKTSAT